MGALAACLLKILTDHLLSERRKTATIPIHRLFHMFDVTITFYLWNCQGGGAEFSKFKRYCHSGVDLLQGFVQFFTGKSGGVGKGTIRISPFGENYAIMHPYNGKGRSL
jgi:hypothetical protein